MTEAGSIRQGGFDFGVPLREQVNEARLAEMRAAATSSTEARKKCALSSVNNAQGAPLKAEPHFTPAQARREASDAAMAKKQQMYARILQWAAKVGDFTVDELAAEWGCPTTHVAPRVTELLDLGKLRPTGKRRKTRMGKGAAVLVTT